MTQDHMLHQQKLVNMTGETAGVVVESKSKLFRVGDKVCAHKGWQTYIKAKDTDPALLKVPETDIGLSSFLGTLGMPEEPHTLD